MGIVGQAPRALLCHLKTTDSAAAIGRGTTRHNLVHSILRPIPGSKLWTWRSLCSTSCVCYPGTAGLAHEHGIAPLHKGSSACCGRWFTSQHS